MIKLQRGAVVLEQVVCWLRSPADPRTLVIFAGVGVSVAVGQNESPTPDEIERQLVEHFSATAPSGAGPATGRTWVSDGNVSLSVSRYREGGGIIQLSCNYSGIQFEYNARTALELAAHLTQGDRT